MLRTSVLSKDNYFMVLVYLQNPQTYKQKYIPVLLPIGVSTHACVQACVRAMLYL